MAPADAVARGVVDGAPVRLGNERGTLAARARVTDHIVPGTVWMRDGWPGLNALTGGTAVLPDAAAEHFAFSAGQARFDAQVQVTPA
jgi:anaerobic selenocysteine-containing dehydrogenase